MAHSTFARSGTDLRQAQHFRNIRYTFRSKRSTFARSGTDFITGTVLSQGQVQITQGQHFRKVRYEKGQLSQGQVQISWQRQVQIS